MPYPMIDETAGQLLVADGRLYRREDSKAGRFFTPSAETMYYEVIRVRNRVPLFWEDHIERLQRSVAQAFAVCPAVLRQEALQLIAAEGKDDCNVRIVLTTRHRVIHLSPYYYPHDEMIASGVACGLLAWERENPQVKTVRADYKHAVAAALAKSHPWGRPFEVLLVDRAARLTEGSRANLFFVAGDCVYGAPDARILLGITRRHVQRAIAAAGYRLQDQLFTMAEIAAGAVTAGFLTASPIDVLPIARIGDVELEVDNRVVRAIRARYLTLLDDYVRQKS